MKRLVILLLAVLSLGPAPKAQQPPPLIAESGPVFYTPDGNKIWIFRVQGDAFNFALSEHKAIRSGSPTAKYPLHVLLHGAPGGVLIDASQLAITSTDLAVGYYLTPVDSQTNFWMGAPVGNSWSPTSELRVMDYVTRILPLFPQIDSARIYLEGASMGGQGMHWVFNHPAFWTAGSFAVAYPGTCVGWSNLALPVVGTSYTVAQYYDVGVTGQSGVKSPLYYHWGSNDQQMCDPQPALHFQQAEAAWQPVFVHWSADGHANIGPPSHLITDRFKKTEAYPAFKNASSSSPYGGAAGQRNLMLNWAIIEDASDHFTADVISLAGQQTVDVRFLNKQQYQGAAECVGLNVSTTVRLTWPGANCASPPPPPPPPPPPTWQSIGLSPQWNSGTDQIRWCDAQGHCWGALSRSN